MATAPIDVALRVRGGKELDQLIKRMDKLETETEQTQKALKQAFSRQTFSGINQGTTSLNRFTKETIAAQRQLDKLKRSGQAVNALNLGATGAAAAAGAGAGTGAAAAGAALASGVRKQSSAQKELNSLIAQSEPLIEKVADASEKIANQDQQKLELQKKLNIQEGYLGNLKDKNSQAYRDQLKLVGDTKKEINKINSSQRGSNNWIKIWGKDLDKTNSKAQKLTNTIYRTELVGKKLKGTLSKIGRGFGRAGNLIAGAGLGLFAKSAFNAAANVENLQARVGILTTEFTQLAGIEKIAAQSADRLKLANSEVLESYIDLGNRLGEQGTSLSDIQNVYEGLNTVLVKNKVNAQGAASATLQLNQALGSGRLAGEEFNAINEATPQVISEIAKVLKVARGQVKGLAADGLVSSQVVIQALTNINKNGAAQLEEGFTGAFGAQREFNKALTEFKEVVGDELLPVITPFIQGLTELLKGFGELEPFVQKAIIGFVAFSAGALILGPAIVAVGKAVFGLAGFLGSLKLGAAAAGVSKLTLAFTGLKVAMLALPWAALIAGLTAAAIAIQKTINKQRELNKVLEGGAESLTQIGTQISIAQTKFLAAEKRLEGMTKASVKNQGAIDLQREYVEKLRLELENLRGIYNAEIRLTTFLNGKGVDTKTLAQGFYGPAGGVTPKPIENLTKDLSLDTSGDGKAKGGGAGAAPATDDVEALKRQLDLTKDLIAFEAKRNEAELAGNDVAVARIDGEIALRELQASGLDALAGLNTEEGRLLQTQQNQLDVVRQLQTTEAARALQAKEKALAEATAIKDALRPLQEQKRILEATLNGRGEEERLLIQIENITDGLPDTEKARVEQLVRGNAELQKQVDQAAELERLYDQVSQRIQDGIVDGITAAIDGTKSLQEVLADVLKDIGKMFLKFAVNSAFSGLGFADGGRPPMEQISVVGERGPELFVPDSPGTVLTNDQAFAAARGAMGGVGSGSSSEDGGLGSEAINRSFSESNNSTSMTNSYMRERSMERESMAVMGGAGSMVIETQVINNVEYASVEQVQAAAAGAAKQARAQVFSDMRNNLQFDPR